MASGMRWDLRAWVGIPCVVLPILAACGGGGGGGSSPPAPSPDFSIQVSASSVGTVVGTTTPPVTVLVNALNGFSGSVSVALTGLPANVTSSQTFPLSIAANSSAQVTFTAAPAASIGSFSLVFSGSSGTLSHSALLTLNLTTSLMAAIDVPQPSASVTGSVMVSGWAFEALPLSQVQVLVDNSIQGQAVYGFPRPDVHMGIPSAPINSGYYFRLDTTTLVNGSHSLSLRITDTSNNVSNFGAVSFNVNNPAPLPTGPVANLSITAPTASLTVGNIVSFTPVATDAGGNPVAPAFTWQSSAPSIAKVAPNGVVLALTPGSANITVSAGGKTSAPVGVTVAAASGTPGTIQVTLGAEEVVFQYPRDSSALRMGACCSTQASPCTGSKASAPTSIRSSVRARRRCLRRIRRIPAPSRIGSGSSRPTTTEA